MRKMLAIAGKEIKASFVTPLAYAVIAGFLLLAGFFFFSLLQQFNAVIYQAAMIPDMRPSLNEWVITPYFQTLEIVVLFLIPILTMRTIAEERRSGTFELLMTSPVGTGAVVWGKFLSISFVLLVMLVLSFVFPAVLLVFTEPEIMPTLIGFVGLVLFSLALASLGVAVSSFAKSQTVAGVVSLVLLLLFYVIDAPAPKFGELGEAILTYLAPSTHTEGMLKGVIEGRNIVYFLSVMFTGLFVANRALDAERWR